MIRSAIPLALAATLTVQPALAQQGPPGGTPYTSVPAVPIHRCANLGNTFEQPDGLPWGGAMPTRESLLDIKAHGFDTVRLPIRWSAYAGDAPPHTIDPKFTAKVDQVVGWATDAGLNIIVDLHHFDALYADPAAYRAELVALWEQIADHYKDAAPNVLFEVLNEPHDKLDNETLEPMLADVLATIRRTNPTRTVIMGGQFWSGISSLATFDPPSDPNVVATFHFYEPFAFTHQGASWVDDPPPAPRDFGLPGDADWFDTMQREVVAFQERTGVPLFLGEFGAIDSADIKERARYTYAVRRAAEWLGVPWCVWSYDNTFHIHRDGRWLPIMLKALGLPSESAGPLQETPQSPPAVASEPATRP